MQRYEKQFDITLIKQQLAWTISIYQLLCLRHQSNWTFQSISSNCGNPPLLNVAICVLVMCAFRLHIWHLYRSYIQSTIRSVVFTDILSSLFWNFLVEKDVTPLVHGDSTTTTLSARKATEMFDGWSHRALQLNKNSGEILHF